MGTLLLCLGVGSLIAMPVSGAVASRTGSRKVILASAVLIALALSFLAAAATPVLLGVGLFVFGASLGSLDVAMNLQAVEVEAASDRPLMAGFHGLFSVGGMAGAGCLTVLLSAGLEPVPAAMACAALMLGAMVLAAPRLLKTRPVEGEPGFALPRGVVVLLAALTAAAFLMEGAILDWSALLITEAKLLKVEQGGLGYMLFSIAMTIGRLSGDRIVDRAGEWKVLAWGGVIALVGFTILLSVPQTLIAMTGFLLIGFGAANLAPVLFSLAGRQTVMPTGLAIAAITTTGYAGILAGPAAIGFLADAIGLKQAFWLLAALMILFPLLAKRVTRDER